MTEKFSNGGIVSKTSVYWNNPGYVVTGVSATVNVTGLLALAAVTLGLDEPEQRKSFYAKARNLFLNKDLTTEYIYERLIEIGYEVKYG